MPIGPSSPRALPWTDSYRDAIASLIALFAAGFPLLPLTDLSAACARPGTGYPAGSEVSIPRVSASRSVCAVISEVLPGDLARALGLARHDRLAQRDVLPHRPLIHPRVVVVRLDGQPEA